ncbi:MAG TPA: MEDS domain-containing protein [Candidatus Baltobacteraceae bacterium]
MNRVPGWDPKHTGDNVHLVQLFGADRQPLISRLSTYFAEGLRNGDGLLIVSGRSLFDALLPGLVQVQHGRAAEGSLWRSLRFIDAHELLERISIADEPDWDAFESAVTSELEKLARACGCKRVRVYGEMVGLLWTQGRRASALQLENFWNRLLEWSDFDLYCGYPIDIFSADFALGAVDGVFCAHTHLVSSAPDTALEDAVERGMREVLGTRVERLRALMKANFRPAWANVPRGESLILWLRNNLPDEAENILARARAHFEARAHGVPLATEPA